MLQTLCRHEYQHSVALGGEALGQREVARTVGYGTIKAKPAPSNAAHTAPG